MKISALRVAAAAFFFAGSSAFAQTGGIFAPGQVYGNFSSATTTAKPSNLPALDIRSFGTSVCTGSDDTAAFQAAVNAASSNSGQTIVLPAAACHISSPGVSLLNKVNVRITGQGAGDGVSGSDQSSIIYTSATGSALVVDGVTGFELDHVAVYYSNASYNGDLLDLRQINGTSNTDLVKIHDCFMEGINSTTASSLINLGNGGTGGHATLSTRIERCFFQRAVQIIKGGAATNNVYIANNFFNQGSTTSHIGIQGEGWTIFNNTFEPSNGTIGNNITVNGAVNGLLIQGNVFNDSATGTLIDLTGAVATGVTISGNTLQGATTSVSAGSAVGIQITGNYLSYNGVCGTVVSSATIVTVTANSTVPATSVVCALPGSGVYFIDPQDSSGNLFMSSLTVGGTLTDSNGLLLTNIAAPSTPASGKTRVYTDLTQKILTAKNDAGTVSNTVVPSTCAGVQFVNSLSAAGVLGCAGVTATTNANLTGDVTSVGNATTLTNAPVIAKVLTGYVSGAGTVSATDSILAAFQKINGNDALKAPLASPALTGTPTAPTATVGTNTTQLATTAFVLANAGSGAVSSVSNSDGTLTISPTTGAVVASLALGHANAWTAAQTIASASANCFSAGLNVTNPALNVDCSTASSATGLNVKSAAAGSGLAVSVLSSGSNENLSINAKGTGTIGIGSVSSGAVTITPAVTHSGTTTLSGALTYGGVTLSNAVSGTGNMALTAGTTLTGTTTVATLAATTINGFTLGGTVLGGANSINNVVIGAITPLAGSFTTLSASTSLTLSAITGSTQCLHVNSSGVVSGATSDCGGGSYNAAQRAGAFDVWQRLVNGATTIAQAASITAYVNDGWYLLTNASQAATVTQVSGIATGSVFAAKVQRNNAQTGTGVIRYAMPLDTDELVPLQGSNVALSFTIKEGANQSFSHSVTAAVFCGTGAPAKRGASAYTGETSVVSVAVTTTTTPTRTQGTSSSTVPTNCTQMEIQFNITPSGTAGADDSFTVDDVQLEPVSSSSSVASPFIKRNMRLQLADCQRFLPVYNSTTGAAAQNLAFGSALSTTTAFVIFQLHVPTRVPTTGLIVSSPSHFNFTNGSGSGQNATAVAVIGSAVNSNDSASVLITVASGLTLGQGGGFQNANTAAAQLIFTGAEI